MVEPFSSLLRAEADPIWQRIFVNPFLKELRQGTLPIEKFRFYLAQDYLYLEGFARTVAVALALAKGAGINTVDPNGGQTSSLAIGIDGSPLIAYIADKGPLPWPTVRTWLAPESRSPAWTSPKTTSLRWP